MTFLQKAAGPLAAALLLFQFPAPSPAAPATAPSACSQAAYRAMDFTIGTWNVTGPGGVSYGKSTIEYGLYGCLIFERWSGGGLAGRVVDAYDAEDGRWHRFFVNSSGKVHVFEGAATVGELRYEGASTDDGATVLNRLVIRKSGPRSMTQRWEKSTDGGKTWHGAFAAIYELVSPG